MPKLLTPDELKTMRQDDRTCDRKGNIAHDRHRLLSHVSTQQATIDDLTAKLGECLNFIQDVADGNGSGNMGDEAQICAEEFMKQMEAKRDA